MRWRRIRRFVLLVRSSAPPIGVAGRGRDAPGTGERWPDGPVAPDRNATGSGEATLTIERAAELLEIFQWLTPEQSAPRSAGPISLRKVGEQPRWVQTPFTTKTSGEADRLAFLAKAGCDDFSDIGSANRASFFASWATCSGERRMIQCGAPRYSTVTN